jgi:hypothetical protein
MERKILKKVNQGFCLFNPENNSVIRRYISSNRVLDFKEITDKIIVQEEPNPNETMSNIYCLDFEFNTLWHSELPFLNDFYPNSIVWDSKIKKEAKSWDEAYEFDSNSFTTASMKGITVSINYETGKISDSLFTK